MTEAGEFSDTAERDEGSRGPRAFVHVGAPQAGAAFLQQVLWANRRALSSAGLLLPGSGVGTHHTAALELRGAAFSGHRDPDMVAAWERLVAEAGDWTGDLLVSSELLAWATPEEAARAVASLSDRFEVHVVVTARDLARQVPAVWQEEMKNRRVVSYQHFLEELVDPDAGELGPAGIWGGQDLRLVTRSWAADLPPERVHVITVPSQGEAHEALWQRFCEVVGIDPAAYDTSAGATDTELGHAEAELLRRVNTELPDTFDWPSYRDLVKHGIAEDPLGSRAERVGPPLPEVVTSAITQRTRAIVDHVRSRGYAVTGDLAELDSGGGDTDLAIETITVDEGRVAAAGVDSVVALLSRMSGTSEARPAGEPGTSQDEQPVEPYSGQVDLRPRHRPAHAQRKTVFLLVGSPKTGLDRVRGALWRSRAALAKQDVHFPLGEHDHFLATMDLRGVADEHPDAQGAWARLAGELAQVRSGTWLIGHELMAPVTAERAIAAIRRLTPAEVHVVVVARGLDRQIPAEWLESLRHGSVTPFGQYADHVVASLDPRPHVPWFWQVQDPVDIAERWGSSVSPDKVHVITSPGGVSDADEQLLRRLCAVTGIALDSVDTSGLHAPDEPRDVDAEILRRLNVALQDQPWAMAGEPPHPTTAYGLAVRDIVAKRVLARVPEPRSVALPAGFDVWLARQARTVVEELTARRYDIVGDLAELQPAAVPRADLVLPEALGERALLPAALEAVTGLSGELREPLGEVERLRAALAEAEVERDRLAAQVERLTGPMRAGRKVFDAFRGPR